MTTAPKVCDNTAVYMLIHRDGRVLTFDRVKPPPGVAGPAGHIDEHGDSEAAVRAEVSEEVGLTVTSMQLRSYRWRDNVCRRLPGPRGVGHESYFYEVGVVGDPAANVTETTKIRWRDPAELQALADRTIAFAYGRITPAAFTASPGVEPVWVEYLQLMNIIKASRRDLAAVELLAARPYWEE